MRKTRLLLIGGMVVVCLAVLSQAGAQEPNLTEQEMKQFLLQSMATDAEQWATHPRRGLSIR